MNKNRKIIEHDYTFNYWLEKIKNAKTENELAKIAEDLDADQEATNLSEEEAEMLKGYLMDREGDILVEYLEE